VKVGVKEVILAVNVNPDQMMDFLKECEKKVGVCPAAELTEQICVQYNIKVHCSKEDEPMGTGMFSAWRYYRLSLSAVQPALWRWPRSGSPPTRSPSSCSTGID
jgi:hypothetical protein